MSSVSCIWFHGDREYGAVAARDWQGERRRKWRLIRLWPFMPEGWEMGRYFHLSLLPSYSLFWGCCTAEKGGRKIRLTWPVTWVCCCSCCSQIKMDRLPLSLSIEAALWLGPLVGSLSCPLTQFSEDADGLRSLHFQMLVGLSLLETCLWSPCHYESLTCPTQVYQDPLISVPWLLTNSLSTPKSKTENAEQKLTWG